MNWTEMRLVPREHVLFVDRVGYDRYRGRDGEPAFDPGRFDVHLVTPAALRGQARPGEVSELSDLTMDSERLTRLAVAVHERRPLQRLVVCTERLLLWGGRTRDLLGLPGPGAADVLPFRDKAVMKRRAADAGLPTCRWTPARHLDEAAALLREAGQVIVKPADGTGSAGITRCATEAELRAAIAATGPDSALVEEFVPDEMLHIDAVVRGGQVRHATVSRYLVPTTSYREGIPVPSVTVDDPEVCDRAREHLLRCAAGFAVRDAVLHLEVFHRPPNHGPADHRLLFNEMACRAGGAGVGTVFATLTGVNLYQAMVAAALGEPAADPPPLPRPRAAGWILVYAADGIVEAITEPPDPIPGLVERRCSVRVGEPATGPGLIGAGALAYIVAGDSEAEVTGRLNQIAVQASVTVRPAERPAEPADPVRAAS
jgi:hypothetical protein